MINGSSEVIASICESSSRRDNETGKVEVVAWDGVDWLGSILGFLAFDAEVLGETESVLFLDSLSLRIRIEHFER